MGSPPPAPSRQKACAGRLIAQIPRQADPDAGQSFGCADLSAAHGTARRSRFQDRPLEPSLQTSALRRRAIVRTRTARQGGRPSVLRASATAICPHAPRMVAVVRSHMTRRSPHREISDVDRIRRPGCRAARTSRSRPPRSRSVATPTSRKGRRARRWRRPQPSLVPTCIQSCSRSWPFPPVSLSLAGSLPWLATFHSSRDRVRAGDVPSGGVRIFLRNGAAATGTKGFVAGSTARREVPKPPAPRFPSVAPPLLRGFFCATPRPAAGPGFPRSGCPQPSPVRLNSVANSADLTGNDESGA